MTCTRRAPPSPRLRLRGRNPDLPTPRTTPGCGSPRLGDPGVGIPFVVRQRQVCDLAPVPVPACAPSRRCMPTTLRQKAFTRTNTAVRVCLHTWAPDPPHNPVPANAPATPPQNAYIPEVISDAVIAYGTTLVDDPNPIGDVTALGLGETLVARVGRGARNVGRPRSSMSAPGSSSMSSMAATPPRHACGSRSAAPSGVSGSRSGLSICRARITRCSTRWSPTGWQVAVPSTWRSSRTRSSTNAANKSLGLLEAGDPRAPTRAS